MKKNRIVWSLITLAILVWIVIQPRPQNVLMLIISGIITLVIFCKTTPTNDENENESEKIRQKNSLTIANIIGAVILANLFMFGWILNLGGSYHALHEYPLDIARLNNYISCKNFPRQIPECAKKTRWFYAPPLMQGHGYFSLSFIADDHYIDKMYAKYKDSSTICTYSTKYNRWYNTEKDYSPSTRAMELPNPGNENAVLMVFNDNGDWNHPMIGALYMNKSTKKVIYMAV